MTIFILGGGEPSVSSVFPWLNTGKLKSFLSIKIDRKFIFFSSAALLVTWSIIEFSIYYMRADPNGKNFFRLLMIFLLKMLILTSAKNIFLFFCRLRRSWVFVFFTNKVVIHSNGCESLRSSGYSIQTDRRYWNYSCNIWATNKNKKLGYKKSVHEKN